MLAVRNANGICLFPEAARFADPQRQARAKGAADGPRPRPPAGAPLASLAGGALARRFCAWRGASGRRYVFSAFDRDEVEAGDFAFALLLVCAVDGDGSRRPLALLDTGALPALATAEAARRAGSGRLEWHVHLMADSAAERAAALADIRRGLAQA